MKAQQTSVIWVNQNSTMGFPNIQGQLNQLLIRKVLRCRVHEVRDLGQEHVIGNASVGSDNGHGTVNNETRRASICNDNTQLAHSNLIILATKFFQATMDWSHENKFLHQIMMIESALPSR